MAARTASQAIQTMAGSRDKIGGCDPENQGDPISTRPANHGSTSRACHSLRCKDETGCDAPRKKTLAAEVFKRFTAFENDRRITINHRLPGTYATTEAD